MAQNVQIKPGEEFLGIGFVAPLRRGSTGEFECKAGRDLVAAAVKAILSTKARFVSENTFVSGERFMRDSFGSQAHIMRHENIDDNNIALLESFYVEAIETWEPRAFVRSIRTRVEEFQEKIETTVNVELLGTNQSFNLVIIRNAQGEVTFRDF